MSRKVADSFVGISARSTIAASLATASSRTTAYRAELVPERLRSAMQLVEGKQPESHVYP
jgi:hypothetical protein